ncbi:MAG: hypothetical protein QE271_14130 [Bacteriovoracaceae bacterium]|nr:hypothetical protein [Bacteriovoracaceae bacterium]
MQSNFLKFFFFLFLTTILKLNLYGMESDKFCNESNSVCVTYESLTSRPFQSQQEEKFNLKFYYQHWKYAVEDVKVILWMEMSCLEDGHRGPRTKIENLSKDLYLVSKVWFSMNQLWDLKVQYQLKYFYFMNSFETITIPVQVH